MSDILFIYKSGAKMYRFTTDSKQFVENIPWRLFYRKTVFPGGKITIHSINRWYIQLMIT